MSNIAKFFIFYVFLSHISFINSYIPKILHGRPKGGFIGDPSSSHGYMLPKDIFLIQKLNHFNAADHRTWMQRYFVNESFYHAEGPIFLMIGGEGTANPIWMVEGQWIKYAQHYGALCLQLEHRYYGKSYPTRDLSVDSLIYLSSEQALADLAYFRNYIGEKYKVQNNKWIVFGGSYPGSLAAWFRLKYPHLVDGAISTSAPLQAVIDFKEYLGVVKDALDTTQTHCTEHVRSATKKLELLLQSPSGCQQVQKMFRLCDEIDITNSKDISNLYSVLAGNFEGVVQYNRDNRAFEGAVGTNITIDTLCAIMNVKDADELKNYAKVNSLLLDTYSQKCLDFKYMKMINDIRKTDWKSEAAEGGRQWMYQSCTEFGYFQSSDLINQPFGQHFNINFSVEQCIDIFGPSFNMTFLSKAVKWTNNYYGGQGLKVTRVVFVNGSIDPWHFLSITHNHGVNNTVIYIPGTAHCANMYPDSPQDPPQLRIAREHIKQLIGQWINS